MNTKDTRLDEITRQIDEGIEIKKYLKKEAATLIEIADQIINAYSRDKKVLIFGNGGSAADAQHIAAELVGKLYQKRRSLPAIALTTNTSSLTAIANDFGYDESFTRQVSGLTQDGDIVIGISTSGESPNVIKAIEEAKKLGAITVAFTGQGGKLATMADYVLSIPTKDTARIQEAHITAGHVICYMVEKKVIEDDNRK
jgi:D-sedoheptulose 7-phosphate isomerase